MKKVALPHGQNEQVKELLEQGANSCYVLITCSQPADDGKMEVDFTCSGDPAHALYLVESAQMQLAEQVDLELLTSNQLQQSASAL